MAASLERQPEFAKQVDQNFARADLGLGPEVGAKGAVSSKNPRGVKSRSEVTQQQMILRHSMPH